MKVTNYFLNFDFGGRARRSHYWANLGCWLLVGFGLMALFAATGASQPGAGAAAMGGLAGIALLAVVFCSTIDGIAMVFRRAHDTNRSGWIWLLLLIPLVNLLPFYWLMIQDSDQGPNKYGPPVKQFYVPPAVA